MRKFIVEGTYNGQEIKEEVNANSKSQAKLKAGFSSGNGRNMSDFLKKAKLEIN